MSSLRHYVTKKDKYSQDTEPNRKLIIHDNFSLQRATTTHKRRFYGTHEPIYVPALRILLHSQHNAESLAVTEHEGSQTRGRHT